MATAQKGKRRHFPRRPAVIPEPDSARYNVTMERLFYEPHYQRRGLTVRRINVEGVSAAVLREFTLWETECES